MNWLSFDPYRGGIVYILANYFWPLNTVWLTLLSVCAGVSESGSGTAEARKSAGYVATVSEMGFKCRRGDTASCTCTTLPTGGASTGIGFYVALCIYTKVSLLHS